MLSAIDTISGGSHAIDGTGKITLTGSTTNDLVIGGTGIGKLGLTAATYAVSSTPAVLGGKVLTIAATDRGTATSITFGTSSGQISTLDQLNTALAANNLSASINSTGALTFTTNNDHAHATIGAFGGSAVAAGAGLFGALSSAELTLLPVARRFCVVESRSAVDWSESRFWRTDAERTIPDIFIPFWCEYTYSERSADIHRTGRTARRRL